MVPEGCHHPLGFNSHPLEDAGLHMIPKIFEMIDFSSPNYILGSPNVPRRPSPKRTQGKVGSSLSAEF